MLRIIILFIKTGEQLLNSAFQHHKMQHHPHTIHIVPGKEGLHNSPYQQYHHDKEVEEQNEKSTLQVPASSHQRQRHKSLLTRDELMLSSRGTTHLTVAEASLYGNSRVGNRQRTSAQEISHTLPVIHTIRGGAPMDQPGITVEYQDEDQILIAEEDPMKLNITGNSTQQLNKMSFKERIARMQRIKMGDTTMEEGQLTYQQPEYTFSQDQEPLDLHKRLLVRLFKRSEKRREATIKKAEVSDNKESMLNSRGLMRGSQIGSAHASKHSGSKTSSYQKPGAKKHHHNPDDNLIKELVISEEDGKTIFKPKNTQNSLRFMHAAQYEIQNIEKEFKQLSQLEKNRIFLKFVEMNESPQKYSHYEHYKENKQRKVKLNISKRDMQSINGKSSYRNKQSNYLMGSLQQGSGDTLGQQLNNTNAITIEATMSGEYAHDERLSELRKIELSIERLKVERRHADQASDHNRSVEIQTKIDYLQEEQKRLSGEQTSKTVEDNYRDGIDAGVVPRHQLSLETMDLFGEPSKMLSNQTLLQPSTNNILQDTLLYPDPNPTLPSINTYRMDQKRLSLNEQANNKTIKLSQTAFAENSPVRIALNNVSPRDSGIGQQQLMFHQSNLNIAPLLNQGDSTHGGSPVPGTFESMALDLKRRPFDTQKMSLSIISPRVQKTLNQINDPLLKIKRSVERFGRDMIDVAKKELDFSIEVEAEAAMKHNAFKQHTKRAIYFGTEVKKKKKRNSRYEDPFANDSDESEVIQDAKNKVLETIVESKPKQFSGEGSPSQIRLQNYNFSPQTNTMRLPEGAIHSPSQSVNPLFHSDSKNILLRNSMARRVMSIEMKIERGDQRLDEAMRRLQEIADYKVADRMSVKEFNKKVQALNFSRKLHKYTNMGEGY